MRVILDTNTVVSGLLWEGTPRRLIGAAREGVIALFSSGPLLDELADVLPRAKFDRKVRASGLTLAQLIISYAQLAQVVTPASMSPVVLADPDDDHVLACALAARADLIVSGDAHLLRLREYQSIPIVTTSEALTRLPQR